MKTPSSSAGEYTAFIADLKGRIQTARVSAARTINRELVALYWDIGAGIAEKQRTLGWGEAVVERVATDLRDAFPQMRGFPARNVWDMRRLYETYTAADFLAQAMREFGRSPGNPILRQPVAGLFPDEKLPQPVAEVAEIDAAAFLPQLVAEIPWGQNLLLLNKLTAPAARLY